MKNILSCLLFLVPIAFACTVSAQVAPLIEWQKSLGGSGHDAAWSVQQTTDGGFIVCGSTASNDDDVSGNHGFYDYWVVRLDATGNIVWQKCLGGSSFDYAYSVRQTADDGFIVAGWSESNDDDVSGNHGGADYWIVKLDATGNLVWQKSLGGTGWEDVYSIQQTADSGFIVFGSSLSNDNDVSGNHGGTDYWVVRLGITGNIIWQKCLGGTGLDYAFSIEQKNNGGFIVAGFSDSGDDDVSGNHGNDDYWIVSLDSQGNIDWQKCFGGSSIEQAHSIQQTSDSGFIVAGTSTSNDGDVSGNHDSADCWIVKLDTTGNLEWQKSFGGHGNEVAYSTQETSDGGFIIAGVTSSNDGDVSGNHGSGDFWVVKTDASGNLVWQKTMGGTKGDAACSIQQTTDGGFIVAGYSNSTDDDVSGNHGDYDYWVVKLASDTLSGIATPPNNFISLYPNPVQTQLTLNVATPAIQVTIRVYDLQGRMIGLPTTFTNKQAQLNTTSLPEGFYTLQITNNETGKREVKKFVKQQ